MKHKQSVAQHITAKGASLDEQAGQVLGSVFVHSPLGEELRVLFDRYQTRIERVRVEEDIDSFASLEEVYATECIENRAECCIEQGPGACETLVIKGFLPPAIEIYRQTTSFRPASFRSDGYPGTEAWFERMDRAFGV